MMMTEEMKDKELDTDHDDTDLDNDAIHEHIFSQAEFRTQNFSDALVRMNKRVEQDTARNLRNMKETLKLASQYTQSNVNNTSMETDNENSSHVSSDDENENHAKDNFKVRSKLKEKKMNNAKEDLDLDEIRRDVLAKSFDDADRQDSLNGLSQKDLETIDPVKNKPEDFATGNKEIKVRQEIVEEVSSGSPKQEEKAKKLSKDEKVEKLETLRRSVKANSVRSKQATLRKTPLDTKTKKYFKEIAKAAKNMLSRDAKPEERRIPRTNLQLRSWSVASYDSCGGDTRRNYANYLMTNKRKKIKEKVANTFHIFKGANDTMFDIPKKLNSEYEDPQPYGPLDEDDPYWFELYNLNQKVSNGNVFSATISRISNKSMSTGKSPRNKKSTANLTNKSKKANRVTLTVSKFFNNTLRKSRSGTQFDDISELSEEEDEKRRFIHDVKEQKASTQAMYEEGAEEDKKIGRYVPPDMEWDEKANDGKGGFVNKVPKYIPKGKIWSKSANQGKGGLINKLPQAGTVLPGKIWSKTAYNGQGGFVNIKPKKIPKGYEWDFDEADGAGALVRKRGYTRERNSFKENETLKRRTERNKDRESFRRPSAEVINTNVITESPTPSPEDIQQNTELNKSFKVKSHKETQDSDNNLEVENEITEKVKKAAEANGPGNKKNGMHLTQKEKELQEYEENLKKREAEIASRETIISEKEAQLKQKELEISTRETMLSPKSRNFDLNSQARSTFEEVEVVEDDGDEDYPGGTLQRNKFSNKKHDSNNDTRKRTAKKTQGSHIRAAQYQKTLPPKGKKINLERLSKSSVDNDVRTSLILDEIGLEQGHVKRLFSRFERSSATSNDYDVDGSEI